MVGLVLNVLAALGRVWRGRLTAEHSLAVADQRTRANALEGDCSRCRSRALQPILPLPEPGYALDRLGRPGRRRSAPLKLAGRFRRRREPRRGRLDPARSRLHRERPRAGAAPSPGPIGRRPRTPPDQRGGSACPTPMELETWSGSSLNRAPVRYLPVDTLLAVEPGRRKALRPLHRPGRDSTSLKRGAGGPVLAASRPVAVELTPPGGAVKRSGRSLGHIPGRAGAPRTRRALGPIVAAGDAPCCSCTGSCSTTLARVSGDARGARRSCAPAASGGNVPDVELTA